MNFMPGMKQQTVRANGIRVNAWIGGEGDPVGPLQAAEDLVGLDQPGKAAS